MPKDYRSDNGLYVAHVVPPEYLQERTPFVQVNGPNNVQLWHTNLKNKIAPLQVYLTDDGEHIVTVNDHGSAGYGDYVLAFYNRTGLVRNYTMEQILHLPASTAQHELFGIVPHSTTSRWWDENSIKFFVEHDGKLFFCIWLHLFDRWQAWEVATGDEVAPDESLLGVCNRKARSWAIEQASKGTPGQTHYEFIGKLKSPEDRQFIEALLLDESFAYCGLSSKTISPRVQAGPRYCLEKYTWCSHRRRLGNDILAKWDGKLCLGAVEGVIILPQSDEPNKAILAVYLIGLDTPSDSWKQRVPVQRLIADFANSQFANYDIDFTRRFPFSIDTVLPGKYRIKVVLDKPPLGCNLPDRTCIPHSGDYENTAIPEIEVKPGQKVGTIMIDCIGRVADEPD